MKNDSNKKRPIDNRIDRYVVRKYIFAKNAAEAIRKERKTAVHDCWIDEDWTKKKQTS